MRRIKSKRSSFVCANDLAERGPTLNVIVEEFLNEWNRFFEHNGQRNGWERCNCQRREACPDVIGISPYFASHGAEVLQVHNGLFTLLRPKENVNSKEGWYGGMRSISRSLGCALCRKGILCERHELSWNRSTLREIWMVV